VSEHFTKNTLGCTAWCKRCSAMTQHRVDSGRRGPCLECIKKLELKNEVERIRRGLAEEQRQDRERQNPRLF